MKKDMPLLHWIILGETGVSSMTLWTALMKLDIPQSLIKRDCDPNFNIPRDPCDFSRCYKLVKQCNISRKQLDEVPLMFPFWKPYIDHWETLCKMYEEKCYEEMYRFMKQLEQQIK